MNVTAVRCPKCRSIDIVIIEFGTMASTWEPGAEEAFHEPGGYFRVEGKCHDCKHGWRLRKHIQMTPELQERLKENGRLLDRIATGVET